MRNFFLMRGIVLAGLGGGLILGALAQNAGVAGGLIIGGVVGGLVSLGAGLVLLGRSRRR